MACKPATERLLRVSLDRLAEVLRRQRWEKVDPLLRRIERLWENLRWESAQGAVDPHPLAERFLLVQHLLQSALGFLNDRRVQLRGRSRVLGAYADALARPLGTVLAFTRDEEGRA